jgi:hypothetical protein
MTQTRKKKKKKKRKEKKKRRPPRPFENQKNGTHQNVFYSCLCTILSHTLEQNCFKKKPEAGWIIEAVIGDKSNANATMLEPERTSWRDEDRLR